MRSWRASALVFGSSAAVLMLEILAGRIMAPYVGVSLESFTGIIGTMLAGIAVGSAVGGVLADRRDPRPLIGPALVLSGALAWASLPIVQLLGPGIGSGPVAIVLLTAAAFLAPATVLSAVAPMIAKLRLASLDDTGSVVGGLSAWGTAGAIAGTFITGFVLVAAVPTRPAVLVIGATLVVSGAVVSWRLGHGVSVGNMAFAVLVAGAAALGMPSPCQLETTYFCVNVVEDPERTGGRSLILDDTRHAYADLDDPTHLELRYVRLLSDVTDAAAGERTDSPLNVLHLGGGGFTFPHYLEVTRPGSTQVVLEIDPELEGIARRHLGYDGSSDIEVRIGDARLALEDLPTDGFDVVVGDAFSSTSVPWHLTTAEVAEELGRVLVPGGVYVMNVIDGGSNDYARAQLATLMAQFDHVAAILPAGRTDGGPLSNQILVASDAPIPDVEIVAADGVLIDGKELRRYVGDAQVLTDDHAPVDQLLQK